MLSRETEQKLVELFITISTGEEKISKFKQNVLSNFNINPIQLYFKLDINNNGYISKNDISSFLKFFSINFIPTDIDYIFYFYDKDNDNVLSFYEFLDLIISDGNYLYKKSYKKKFKHNKISQNELNGEIDINIEKSVVDILVEEIELAKQLNDLILNIKQFNDFSIQDIFYEIKSYSYITNDSLKAFFDRNEISYNDKFIKNIFNRFDNKEINGKISFNKFKNFFDLPYNKNTNSNITLRNNIIGNSVPQTINQTYVSGDIKFNNSNTYTNMAYSNNNQPNFNSYGDSQNFCKLNNDNYRNEEDIQFECSHLSRSGSIESNKDRDINHNCKYISKNSSRNNLYKNYLREKRSKSLEKSLSKSLSRASEAISKTENRNYFDKKMNIRKIKPIYDNYNSNDFNNNSLNENYNDMSNSGSSFHEDLPVKYPVRLDKNLVKRQLPQRRNNNHNTFNFCYDNHYEDINMNNTITNNNIENEQYYPSPQEIHHHHHHHHRNHSDYYNNKNMGNYGNDTDMTYNNEKLYEPPDDDRFNPNNLDLKVYQEDINNGRY